MPLIDLRPFLHDNSIITVCKSMDGKGSQWIILDADDTIEIEFGRIALVWINQIYPFKPDNFNVIEQLIAELNSASPTTDSKGKQKLWRSHFDSIVEFLMNKHIKPQNVLFDFYKKYRYLAHYYFSSITFEEYKDIPSDFKKPSEIVGYTFIKNQPYQIIRVYGFTNLFILDFWELLFNNSVRYKIKQCKKCKEFFRTSAENRDYCVDCKKTNEEYAREYRNHPINKLRKSILAKLDLNKRFANEEGTEKTEKFKRDFEYYMDIVKSGKTSLEKTEDCDNAIKTEEDLIKWLQKIEAEVREYNKEGLENGKTNETCERDRGDHEGIGQTKETLPSDNNPWME